MQFDAIIVGAGVVGLSIARALSKNFSNICLLEKNKTFGLETSSRNSEVIHSGIYYPTGSLKSDLCIEGNRMMYDFCDSKNIRYIKCGKLIIGHKASDLKALNKLSINADHLGINYSFVDKKEIKDLEPLITAKNGLRIDSSGIIDSHSFMAQIYKDILSREVNIAFKTEVIDVDYSNKYYLTIVNPDKSRSKISTEILINSGGLYAKNIPNYLGINNVNEKIHFGKVHIFG